MIKRLLNYLGYKTAYWKHRQILERDEVAARSIIVAAAAHKAARDAVRYYVSYRSLDWWREQIDKAEKEKEKYVALSDFVATIQKENNK